MHTLFPSGNERDRDLKLAHYQIRNTAKFCLALIFTSLLVLKIINAALDKTQPHTSKLIYYVSLPFSILMPVVIILEYLLYKKKPETAVKYSNITDCIVLLLFTADWVAIILSGIYRAQITTKVCFPMSALFSFTTFSWRTLLATLIVQKWPLKIIPPIVALSVATGYAVHFATSGIPFLLVRAIAQIIYVIAIIYCEDKVKWKIMWTSLQHEKWVQVNNFILNSIPENIMILDLQGQTKFISEYCKTFMEDCRLSLHQTTDLLQKVKDLQKLSELKQTTCPSANNMSQITERLTTGNELLVEANEDNPYLLLKADTLDNLITNFKELIRGKALQERQFKIYNGKLKVENQSEKTIEVKISFVHHFQDDYIILILRDTTQRDMVVALEEANKYKDQLLASVSHELRAPLNGTINLVEGAVNSSKIPGNLKETMLIPALRSSKFLLHLINDILDMSQIKEKKLRMTFQTADLRETLENTAHLVELHARKKGIELMLEMDPDLPNNFCTDHMRLSQIVLNLLNNAIKFTKTGVVKLTARPAEAAPWIRISVEDSGIGMSQEDLQKLFSSYTHIEFNPLTDWCSVRSMLSGSKFFENTGIFYSERVKGRQVMNPTGVGLGLNIAFNLSQLLAPKDQGGITVTSLPDQGSTFFFIIENKEVSPLRLGSPVIVGDDSIIVAEESPGVINPMLLSTKQKTSSLSMFPLEAKFLATEDFLVESCSCPKVLIVDDNPFNTMAFETILNSLDIKCESVYNGSCCLKKLLESQNNSCGKECKRYSVVFMDQEMPEMSGSEAVKEIKRLQGETQIVSDLKIIGCTAHKSKEEVDRFLEAGIDQCIHKPISKTMIHDILKELMIM